jgi:Lrp/AsnC family leucine-responsive transcriptional regulator
MRTQQQSVRTLDKLDHRILAVLQKDGRISMKELGEQVGLSVTPCIERVRRMERDGVISGYYARVNPESLGATLLVFVEITLNHKSGNMFEQFRREVLRIPDVQARLISVGAEAAHSSAADFGQFLQKETERWGKVLREANIRPPD